MKAALPMHAMVPLAYYKTTVKLFGQLMHDNLFLCLGGCVQIYTCVCRLYNPVVTIIVVWSFMDCQEKDPKQRTWSVSLQYACLLMTLLEKMQSVASSVIFYQLLKSGDVEQNPGPGK